MQKFKPIPLFLLILVFIFINNCQGPNKEHQNEIESFQKKGSITCNLEKAT